MDYLLGRDAARATSFSGREDPRGFPVIDWQPGDMRYFRMGGYSASYSWLYRTQPSVRICVSFLANQIAHLKLKVYQRGDDETPEYVRDHPLQQLLNRPNPRKSGFDFMRDTVADIAIYDTAYWLKQFSGNTTGPGRTLLLYRLPPGLVQPYGGSILTGPEEYRINVDGRTMEFPPERIVDFSGFDPVDTRCGLSPLEALRAVLNEEIASSENRFYYWQNGTQQQGFLSRPATAEPWSDAARERFKTDFDNKNAGAWRAGKWIVLEDGLMPQSIAFSPKDSEFIAGREFSLDTVATAYNIPLAVLSRKQTATFASMREFRKMLYVDTLGPWSARIEGTVEQQLVPDFREDGLEVEFNINEKLQGDFEESADAMRSHVQVPDMSVNDARKLRNEDPFGDPNDEENAFNWPARPANYEYGPPPDAADQEAAAAEPLTVVPDQAARR